MRKKSVEQAETASQTWMVVVKTGSGSMWRKFVRFCRFHGIQFRVPENPVPKAERWIDSETDEWVKDEEPQQRGWHTVYECTGGPAIETLRNMPFVVTSYKPFNNAVSRSISPKAQGQTKKPGSHSNNKHR